MIITHESPQLASLLLMKNHSRISNSVTNNPISKIHRTAKFHDFLEAKSRQYYGDLPKASKNTTTITTKQFANHKSDLTSISAKLSSIIVKAPNLNQKKTRPCNFCKSVFGNCSKDLHIFDSCYIP